MLRDHCSCRQWGCVEVTYVWLGALQFSSLEKAAAGGRGKHLVVVVLPTMAIMRMVLIENKGYNLT